MESLDHRKSEQELRESEERYRKLLELLPEAIVVHSEGRVEYINAAGARLWGVDSPEALKGKRYMDILHPEDREFVQQRINQIYQKGEKSPLREYRILPLSGGTVHIEASGTLITYKGKPANLVMFRDITARKEAEEALRENVSRYKSLFENSPIALWEEDWTKLKIHFDGLRATGISDFSEYLKKDKDALAYCFSLLQLKDANKACVEFYEARDKTELMGNLEKLFPDESDIIREGLAGLAEGKRFVVSEGITHTLSGEEKHVVYHFTVSPGYEGTWAKVILSVIDLTSMKQAEQRLRAVNEKLRKEEAQRRLLSQRLMEMGENDRRNVAMELHDHFGQMLTTQKMDLEIIAAGLSKADPPVLARIQETTEKITQTINDLKKLASGLMPSLIENLGLLPSLRSLIDDVRDRTGMEIQFFSNGFAERFPQEKELALYRIAQEAVNNIVKHAGAGKAFVNLVRKGDVLSLSIEDDGVGFVYNEETHSLWQGGPLGLHIMRERAAQFGGELTIESRPGCGTHILAEIPL